MQVAFPNRNVPQVHSDQRPIQVIDYHISNRRKHRESRWVRRSVQTSPDWPQLGGLPAVSNPAVEWPPQGPSSPFSQDSPLGSRFTFTQLSAGLGFHLCKHHSQPTRGGRLKNGSEHGVSPWRERLYTASAVFVPVWVWNTSALLLQLARPLAAYFPPRVPADLRFFTTMKWRSLLDKFTVLWSANNSFLYIYIHNHYWPRKYITPTGPRAAERATTCFIGPCFRHLSMRRLGQNRGFL